MLKMNALVDPRMIDALYEASPGGRRDRPDRPRHLLPAPGGPGPVREHPRALDRRPVPRALADLPVRRARREAAHYIGSADLMPRNLDRRVEALVPVAAPSLAARLDEILDVLHAGRHARVDARPGRDVDQGARRARDRRAPASPGAGGRARGVAPGVSRTPASTNLERETKLQAPAGFRLPELGGDGLVATEMEPQRLVTVYVDTPDLRIVRWGSSLRHRQGGGVDRQAPLVGQRVAARPHRGQLRGRGREEAADGGRRPGPRLRPRRGARPRRSVADRPSRRRDRRRGGHAAGRGDRRRGVGDGRAARGEPVPRAGGRARPRRRCWRSRRSSSSASTEAGAGPVDNVPKLVRALGPRAASPPDVEVPELDEHASVTDVVRRELATSVVRLLRHDAGVRLGEDPEERPPGEGGHAARALGAPDVPRRARAGLGDLAARPACGGWPTRSVPCATPRSCATASARGSRCCPRATARVSRSS